MRLRNGPLVPPDGLTAVEFLGAMTGATHRQLDHWAHRGYLGRPVASHGPGIPRRWEAVDIAVAAGLVDVSTALRPMVPSALVVIGSRIRDAALNGAAAVAVPLSNGVTVEVRIRRLDWWRYAAKETS